MLQALNKWALGHHFSIGVLRWAKNHCTIMLDVRNMVEGLNFSFVLMGQAWEIIKFKYSWM